MSLDDDIRALRLVPMLGEFSDEKLRLLAFSAENRRFRAGQRLFAAGERADGGYVVRSGQIGLYAKGDDDRPIELIASGGLVGELALIVDGERATTAIAVEDSEVIQIRRPLFRRMLEEYPDLARRLQARLAAGLVETTRALLPVKRRLDALDT
jgi:CRP-like cAMP-binding protein